MKTIFKLLLGASSLIICFSESSAQPSKSTLSLQQSIEHAILHNPGILMNAESIEADKRDIDIAKSGKKPSLLGTLSGGYAKQDSSFNLADDASISGPITTIEGKFSQPIYDGNKTKSQLEAARAQLASTKSLATAEQKKLTFDVISAYYDVFKNSEIVEARQHGMSIIQRRLDIVLSKFNSGSETEVALLQQKSALAGASSDLIAAKSNLNTSKAVFARLVGVYPDELTPPPRLPDTSETLADIENLSLKHNPSIQQSRFDEEKAMFSLNEAKSAYRPDVDFDVTLRRRTGPVNFGQFSDDTVTTDVIAEVVVTFPFYDGGKRQAQVKKAAALHSKSIYNISRISRDVLFNIRTTLSQLDSLKAEVASRQIAIATYEQALQGMQVQFTSGLASSEDLLSFETDLLNSKIALSQTERDLHVATYRLFYETGTLEPNLIMQGTPSLYSSTEQIRDVPASSSTANLAGTEDQQKTPNFPVNIDP